MENDGNVKVVLPDRERLEQAYELLDEAVNVLYAKLPPGSACSLVDKIEMFLLERL